MPRLPLLAISILAVVGIAGFGGWYFSIRSDEPPPLSLEDAVAAVSSATAEATGDASATSTSTEAAGTSAASDGSFEGTWTVVPEDSIVGYRIAEELANIGSKTAVGRTSEVEGTLEFDGSAITEVSVTADLSTLQSDDSRRDGQLQRQALETNQYPEATFVLTSPIAIDADPASGDPIDATVTGDLTIHGVTKSVELDLRGTFVEGRVVVVGSTVILLADYGIESPESMMVLSVADEATMELQLVFERA